MATATAPKRARKRAKSAAESNGEATINRNGDDPNQTFIDGTEPPKVPVIETTVRKIVALDKEMSAKKEERDALVLKLPRLFKEHELKQYKCHGCTVSIVPGNDVVKISKSKTK